MMTPVTRPLNAVCSIRAPPRLAARIAQVQALQVLHAEHLARGGGKAHASARHAPRSRREMRKASIAFCSTISTLTPIAFTFFTVRKISAM